MAFFSKFFKSKSTDNNKNTPAQANQKQRPTATPVSQPSVDLASVPDNQLINALLAELNAKACLAALDRLTAEADLLTIASKHSVAAVRLASAEKITQYDLLQQLLNHIKGKDKAVYRLCKDRLAEQKDQQSELQARQQRIQYLLDQTKYLTKIGYHPEYSGKLQLIQQEWPTLSAEADAATQQAMTTELALATSILQQHTAEEDARQAKQQAQTAAQATQQSLMQQASGLLERAHTELHTNLAEQVQTISQQWDASLAAFKPNLELGKSFERSLQQLFSIKNSLERYASHQTELTQWLQQETQDAFAAIKEVEHWQKLLQWPENIESPQWWQQLQQKASALKGSQADVQKQQKELVKKAEQILKALEQAINDGHVKKANKLNQQLMTSIKQLPHSLSQALRRQQQALFGQLQEMRDWAGFAILPKKEALIEEMRSLIGSPIANNLLADKIHSLQEEWKALSHAGVQDRELWQQFTEAADQAFEPCKAFFAEQAEIRQKFVAQRHALIEELSHYEQAMNWNSADWPAVQKTLDAARETFRSLGPIERNLHSKTQEQFNAVCDRIHAHLKQQYERNVELKNALVSKAQELAASEDLKGIVEKVKQLQTDWKNIGVMPRGIDQKLWKQFREHCDAIFARLDEQRQERKTEINEHINQAEALVAQALTTDSASALKEASQQLRDLELPKNIAAKLNKQLQDALAEQAQAAKQQALAGLIARLEQLRGTEEAWEQACALPLHAGFNAELFNQARAGELSSDEQASDLCLLMEIVADLESPAADQSRRMELQVQRLADGLGKGLSTADEVRLLIERWLAVNADKALTERFISAVKKAV